MSFCYIYGSLNIDGKEQFLPNFSMIDELAEAKFNDLVASGNGMYTIYMHGSSSFQRYGNYRYQKDTCMVIAADDYWMNSQEEIARCGQAQTNNVQDRSRRRWYVDMDTAYGVPNVEKTESIMAFASMSVENEWNSLTIGGTYLPDNRYVREAVGFIDIPGNRIGNVFKHEPTYSNFFNHPTEGIDIALSQGSIEIGGYYSPDENRLNHNVYRVYYTKSGGTGKATGTSGSAGSVTTSSDDFTDVGAAFVAADVGKYIAIRNATNAINNQTGLITALVGGDPTDTVTLDATAIKQPFVTEASLDWDMRTGPIAEYFIQRRAYNHNYYPSTQWSTTYASKGLLARTQQMKNVMSASSVPCASVYDRGACWWWVNDYDLDDGLGLLRWKHLCAEGWDPVYRDDDITNMPAGIRTFRYISIDDDEKLWIAWDNGTYQPDAPDQQKILAQVDPYPGGTPDARYPDCLGTYEAQSDAADDTGLCSNRPFGVVCDNDNSVTWVFHYTGTRIGGDTDDGGISYTPDYGTTWKRLHKIHTVTGSYFTVNGTTTVAGVSTLFDTEFAVGDWIRIEVLATGALTAQPKENLVNDQTFTLDDGVNTATVFYFDIDGGATGPGTIIDLTGVGTGDASAVATEIRSAINGVVGTLLITASGSGANIVLTADNAGTEANNTITEVLNGGTSLSPTGMSGGLKRSYEVDSITNDTSLETTSAVSVSGDTTSALKGALEDAYARAARGTDLETDYANDCEFSCPCDYDSQGNIFWIPEDRDSVCKWNETNGYVEAIDYSDLNPATTPAFTSGDIKFLRVARVPQATNRSEHPLNNDIWIGSHADGGVRIQGYPTAFGSVKTRYHWSTSQSPDNWPTSVNFIGNPDRTHYNFAPIMDRFTGQIYWITLKDDPTGGSRRQYTVKMAPDSATTQIGYLIYDGLYSSDPTSGYAYAGHPQMSFDDAGLSYMLQPDPGEMTSGTTAKAMMQHGVWQDLNWDGQNWDWCYITMSTDVDFRGAGTGPYVVETLSVGSGLKRAHEDYQAFDHGMTVRFTDAGDATAQSDEFKIDENSTFACYIGAGKDNIQEVNWSLDMYGSPTVFRESTETVHETASPWTSDNGVDGGYIDSATEEVLPLFQRGLAEFDPECSYGTKDGAFGQAADYYYDFITQKGSLNNPSDPHVMAALRIKDEQEVAAPDGYVNGSSDTFYTSGGYTFTSGDVGKSIIIEDAVSSSNRGQVVITAFLSSTSVTTDKTFVSGDESGVKQFHWKLRDIPAVGYVILNYDLTDLRLLTHEDIKLYSSNDYGQNWVKVKEILKDYDVTAEDPISDIEDDGTYFNNFTIGGVNHDMNGNSTRAAVFDLTDLPESQRRRQYWKIWRKDYSSSGDACRQSSMVLKDDNSEYLGLPTDCMLTDADDPLYVSSMISGWRLVLHEGVGTLTPQDDNNNDNYTNILESSSSEFYNASASDGEVTDTGHFITSTGSTFEPEDIGKVMRIPSAVAKSGDPAFTNQFFAIDEYVSDTEVILDKLFTNATSLDWQFLDFGIGDYVHFDTSLFLYDRYQPMKSFDVVVLDVPSATTIYTQTNDIPLVNGGASVTSVPFVIERDFVDGTSRNHPGRSGADLSFQSTLGDSLIEACYTPRFGAQMYSDYAEFVVIRDETAGAVSATDTDNDGRTATITAPGDLSLLMTLKTGRDYILVENATMGRRMFEINTLTPGASTVLTVTYDELWPGETFNHWILRRRDWKTRVKNAVIVGQEQIT